MARKDVDLVIRAKDQASKAVDTIADAIRVLTGETGDLVGSSGKTASAIGQLGKSFGDLNRAFKGLTAGQKISAEFDKASGAIAKLEGNVASAKAEIESLGKAEREAAENTDRLKAKLDEATTSLGKQEAALAKAKSQAKAQNAAYKETETELARVVAQQEKLPAAIEKTSAKVGEAQARYKRLTAEIQNAEAPTKRQTQAQESAGKALATVSARLEKLRAEEAQAADRARELAAALEVQKSAAAEAAAGLERQQKAVADTKVNAAELAKASKEAASAQAGVVNAAAKARDALDRESQSLDKAKVEFDQLRVATGRAEEAIQQFVGQGRQSLEEAVRQQASALRQTRVEFDANEKAVRELAAAVKTTAQPSEKLIGQLAEARGRSATLRGEIGAQSAALQNMRSTLAATGQSYEQIIAAQQRFEAARASAAGRVVDLRSGAGLAVQLEKNREATRQTAAALRDAQGAANGLGAAFARMGPPTREEAAAMAQARSAVSSTREAMIANIEATGRISTAYRQAAAGTISFTEAENRAKAASSELAGTLGRISATTAQTSAAMREAAAAAKQDAAALGEAARDAERVSQVLGTGRQQLSRAATERAQALRTAKNALAANEASVRELAAAVKATSGPNERLIGQLAEARARSTTLRSEIQSQSQAYRQIKGVIASTTNEYDSLIAAQNRAASIKTVTASNVSGARQSQSIAADLERAREGARQAKVALDEARAAGDALSDAFKRMGPPTRDEAAAMAQVRASATEAKAAMQANLTAAGQLGSTFEKASRGTISLAEAQNRAKASTGQLSASLSRIRAEAGQTASSASRAAKGTRDVGDEAGKAKPKVDSLAEAFRKLFGAQRQSLSIAGRVRAQLVALASAYVGLYGAISGVNKTIDAFNVKQRAESRLGVVFKGDEGKVAKELDFLRRTSDRLKLSFADLSDEYSKFAIATQNTNLEGANTRKIFVSVAQAARVYKLDTEQVKGVMTALSQIVSKGSIQMEELRQQLGDRLPGALQILADGMGITVAQLVKLTSEGKVSSDNLVKFADALDKRVAGQLPRSLDSLSANFGQLSNNVYQAFLRLAEGGFIQEISRLIENVNKELRSPEFQSFVDRASAGLASLTSLVTGLVQNFRLVGAVVAGLVGAKIGAWAVDAGRAFIALRGRLGEVATALKTVQTTSTAAGAAAAASGGRFGVLSRGAGIAAGAVRGLTLSIRALLTSTGIGIAITAASIAIGYLSTSASDANETLNKHQELIDKVKNAWDAAAGSTEKFNAAIKGITTSQLEENLLKMKELLQDIKSEADDFFDLTRIEAKRSAYSWVSGSEDAQQQYDALENLGEAFANNSIKAEDFKRLLDEIARNAATDEIREYALALQEIADRAIEQEKNVSDAQKALEAQNGTAKDLRGSLDELTGAVDNSAEAMEARGAKAAEVFKGKLDEIRKLIPELKQQLDDLADTSKLDQMIQGLGMGPFPEDVQNLISRARGETAIGGSFEKTADAVLKAANGAEAAAILLRKFEGFLPTAQPDYTYRNGVKVNSGWRGGFGSDTITREDGSKKKLAPGEAVDLLDANRDLARRIGEYRQIIEKQIGAQRFASFTPAQQAALTSVAYNYGSLPDRILKAVRTGTTDQIANSITSLQYDNKSINQKRRLREAGVFSRGGSAENIEDTIERQQKAADKQAKADATKQERLDRYNEGLDLRLSKEETEAENAGKLTLEETKRQAVEKERLRAKQAGRDLTAEEVSRIEAAAEAEYKRKAATAATKDELKEVKAQEAQIAALRQKQSALQQTLKTATKEGDQAKITSTQEELAGVNAELQAAIDKARQMWEAIGGQAADTALTKLDAAQVKLDNQSRSAQNSYVNWNRVGGLFQSGLVSAIDSFSQEVAQTGNVAEAAKNAFLKFAASFLQQIAQMIIQQAIFNALSSFGVPGLTNPSGGGIGGLATAAVGLLHDGGRVGSAKRSRSVPTALFHNASRFHEGGLPGLKPGEVPAILKKNEEVLDENSPRNIMNGGAAAGAQAAANLKVINAFDAGSFISEGLASEAGEQSFMNFVSANKQAIRQMLG